MKGCITLFVNPGVGGYSVRDYSDRARGISRSIYSRFPIAIGPRIRRRVMVPWGEVNSDSRNADPGRNGEKKERRKCRVPLTDGE